ncbi:dihydrofolate synthase [Bacteroidetes bacterium UKL13-3]|jgi:dihydrofolate synthase/folylpolyglutamate synthase|nr:dihydrofolate synthase [Bacteroidetes bacterium UKL13-3]HCP94490.1 dihydrofolate synthase [Bacteroidota bacterium]
MNYSETLDYLYSQLPMFTRIGIAAFKKDLTNTLTLCEALGNPQQQFKSIHIAGTNGKGSTSHMLASVLQEAGYKVGLYTSPHLKDFRERIRINGQMIPEQTVINFVISNKTMFDTIQPSFFEWTVALCFDYFAQQQVDIAIIETGLGGRLDSTNIITPILSVITNIGWDHMDMLGDTLPKIASEKAGIIKPNVPVVIGEYDPETAQVFIDKSLQENSPVLFSKDVITTLKFTHNNFFSTCDVTLNTQPWLDKLECDLPGLYQQLNIATVLTAITELRKSHLLINDSAIRKGISAVKKNTGLMGRWQILSEKPLTICDTGHNVNGITFVLNQLNQIEYNQLHIVLGMVKDKDISKVLSLLPKTAQYYFCNADIPRALSSDELHQQALAEGLNGNSYGSVKNAWLAAQQDATINDVIFIGGSTFVVAEVV